MSSHDFVWGGGTETKWSSSTVISSICCAVRAPSSGVTSSGTTTNSIEYYFPVLGFVTFKRVVPRGFISVPFHIFRVLFDGVTWLFLVLHLVMMFIEASQTIWNLIFGRRQLRSLLLHKLMHFLRSKFLSCSKRFRREWLFILRTVRSLNRLSERQSQNPE